VRHTEIYFAMLTLAFGMMIFSLIWNLRSITGGDDGLYGIMRTSISLGFVSIPIVKESQYYFVVLFFFMFTLVSIYRIRRSPFGLVLAGIRENHVRTEFAGLAVKRYRLAAFVISGCYAGLAGTLSTLLESNITPFAAHWTHSAEPVLVSLIGGIQTFTGPIVGSVIFMVLREIIERFTQNWMLWFGIILLAIIMGLRGGVVGATSQILKERLGPKSLRKVTYG
jgi:branched-chain amino acid transport system permease protein